MRVDDDEVRHGAFWSPENRIRRATFHDFLNNSLGMAFTEFLGKIARALRQRCRYEVDIELAAHFQDGMEKLVIGLLQLRAFGISGTGNFQLSDVCAERIIAKTKDCIGHGKYDMSAVVVVTKEAAGNKIEASAVLSRIDGAMSGDYLILGPNIDDQMGCGGVYSGIQRPGAYISYTDIGASMNYQGTHVAANRAAVPHFQIDADSAEAASQKITANPGTVKLCDGVYILRTKVTVEMDDLNGNGQVYLNEDKGTVG